uniref:Uncharacterized protein n=1 Tax=Oryza sativa subsp. japonica TaxID=39947 RepID=Q5Z498_ORYSJ|nr:hypothetical protein [Oryza sativa Japonica Group]
MARVDRDTRTRGTGRDGTVLRAMVPRDRIGPAHRRRATASAPRAAVLHHAAALPGCGSEQCRDSRSRRMEARQRLGPAFPLYGGARQNA